MRKTAVKIQYVFVLFFIGVVAFTFAAPIIVTFTNSFMTGFEITIRYSSDVLPSNSFFILEDYPLIHFVRMSLVPAWLTLKQYLSLLIDDMYLTGLWNSVLITVPSVIGQMLVALPAAYAFEHIKLKYKEILFFLYILIMLMPLPVVLVPQFIVAKGFGINESPLAIILPAVFNPFGVFLLRQFLKTLPLECLEAAKIDGAGLFRILWAIVVPLVKPAIAALTLLLFIDYWNVVDQAIVFITNPLQMPLSVYLSQLIGRYDFIFAASFFYMAPALIVCLHGQEYLMTGLKLSGIR